MVLAPWRCWWIRRFKTKEIDMRIKRILAATAIALPLFASGVLADSLDSGASAGIFTTAAVSGTNPTTTGYTLSIQSAEYLNGSAGYADYGGMSAGGGLNLGGVTTDAIFAYLVTQTQGSGSVSTFALNTSLSAGQILKTGVFTNDTGTTAQPNPVSYNGTFSTVAWTFTPLELSNNGHSSEILLFAVAAPVAIAFEPVQTLDSQTGTGLALSPGTLLPGGDPLPSPAAMSGGLGLLGLLAGARIRKRQFNC
jgi:hypothetical protein